MKIAAIVYEFPSVSETFVLSQLRGLRDNGCKVSVFADSIGSFASGDAAPVSEFSSVAYFGLPLKSVRESYGKYRGARGADAEPQGGHRKSGAAGQLARSFRLRLEARSFFGYPRFDVICAHFGPNGVRAVRLRERKALRGPIVTSFYGYDIGRRWRHEGYAQLFEQGDRFIALSGHMRSRLVELGCPADRLVVHRLGVDVSKFHRSSPRHGASFEILSVARLVEKKGIEYALRAAATLKSTNTNFRYTVIGDGPLRGQLEGLIESLDLGDNVRLTGALPHTEVAELMRTSDVLLAPSVTARDGDVEGTPVAILEAAATGLPVVATHHAGIPEIVADGVSGFLVPERDASTLAARLMELCDSRKLRVEMGRAGHDFVARCHDNTALNRDLLRLLERVRDECGSPL